MTWRIIGHATEVDLWREYRSEKITFDRREDLRDELGSLILWANDELGKTMALPQGEVPARPSQLEDTSDWEKGLKAE